MWDANITQPHPVFSLEELFSLFDFVRAEHSPLPKGIDSVGMDVDYWAEYDLLKEDARKLPQDIQHSLYRNLVKQDGFFHDGFHDGEGHNFFTNFCYKGKTEHNQGNGFFCPEFEEGDVKEFEFTSNEHYKKAYECRLAALKGEIRRAGFDINPESRM